MVPAQCLAPHTDEHEERKDRKRDNLLNNLELPKCEGASEGGRTEAVGRDHKAVLGQSDQPRNEDDGHQTQLLELGLEGDLAVPGQRHEGIRYDQEADCRECSKHWIQNLAAKVEKKRDMMHTKRQKYALVTGAAFGMGLCYVRRLAEMGYAVVAVDRRAEELLVRCREVGGVTGQRVVPFVQDLTADDAVERIVTFVDQQQFEIEVLVCNAGVLAFGGFLSLDRAKIEQIVTLHISTHTQFVRTFGERMRARKRGYILWVSSATAWIPYPSIALYAATKSYVKQLAAALHDEWAQDGVVVTALCPGAVDTPFYRLSERMRRWLLRVGAMLTADEVARRALRALFRGRKCIVPGWAAKVMVLAGRIVPSWVIRRVVKIERVKKLLA